MPMKSFRVRLSSFGDVGVLCSKSLLSSWGRGTLLLAENWLKLIRISATPC